MTDSRPASTIGVVGFLYAIYAWFVFIIGVSLAIVAALVLPALERRRRWVTVFARLPFTLARMNTKVVGQEKLPSGDCVVVANHASYLDGVLLQAFLPPRFSYVIKNDMQKVPVVGFLLNRIGSRFVERFDTSGSVRDARHLLKAAKAGESLAFFPEGTFLVEPGLGRFRAGAFAAAIKAEVPIVPVVISGTRKILPGDTFLPRPGNIRIDILNPIDHSDPAYARSKELAELARQRILEVLDEPDLLSEATE